MTTTHDASFWGYLDDTKELRWAWSCTCGKYRAPLADEAAAREAAEGHVRGRGTVARRLPFEIRSNPRG